ncbi:purine-binding chemotaxis protein CheW [Candidatus Magnetomoraceae bacterium gMMP-15]
MNIIKKTNNQTQDTISVMVFNLADHEHAVDVRKVKEILRGADISKVIEAMDFVEGVIKLRGRIVPVVNLRKRLNFPEYETNSDSCIIIIYLNQGLAGLRVDSVSELLTIPRSQIEAPTEIIGGIRTHFIYGVAYLDDRFMVILNFDQILSIDEEISLNKLEMPYDPEDESKKPEQLQVKTDEIHKLLIRKIIAFELDDEVYGADVEEVFEIKEMVSIMPIPNVPDFILGLINIRGNVVPVIDLRIIFNLTQKIWDNESRIIIMKEDNLLVGVVVDCVWELLRLPNDSFQTPSAAMGKINSQYFKEISLVDQRMIIVLDIKKILRETSQGLTL